MIRRILCKIGWHGWYRVTYASWRCYHCPAYALDKDYC